MVSPGFILPLFYSDIDDNALVAVIDRVEYERSERCVIIGYGRGNIENDAFENLFDILARLCRDARSVRAIEAYDLLDLGSNSVGVGGGQVYFIDNGDYLKVVVERQICVSRASALRFPATRRL